MSYEVYIKVEHHDKHYYGDDPGRESTAFKFTDGPEPLEHVVNGLRAFADDIDPNFRCDHCGALRRDHHREGHLYHCFNRFGPITQASWWATPEEERVS